MMTGGAAGPDAQRLLGCVASAHQTSVASAHQTSVQPMIVGTPLQVVAITARPLGESDRGRGRADLVKNASAQRRCDGAVRR